MFLVIDNMMKSAIINMDNVNTIEVKTFFDNGWLSIEFSPGPYECFNIHRKTWDNLIKAIKNNERVFELDEEIIEDE